MAVPRAERGDELHSFDESGRTCGSWVFASTSKMLCRTKKRESDHSVVDSGVPTQTGMSAFVCGEEMTIRQSNGAHNKRRQWTPDLGSG